VVSLSSLLQGDLWARPTPADKDWGPLDRIRSDLAGRYIGDAPEKLKALPPSAARDLLLGYALYAAGSNDEAGRNDEVRRVLAPLLLDPDNGLTAAGREIVLEILQEIVPGLEEKGAAGILRRFYFGRRPEAGSTLYQGVLSLKSYFAARPPAKIIQGGEYYIEFLKRYSSYTPLIEKCDESLGGGYFLVANGRGCVIDPGYDFLENFRRRHTVADIHAVVVTHNHDDHNADLPALLSLLHHQKSKKNTVHFYLDRATLKDHEHQIDEERLHALSAPLREWKSDAPFFSVFPSLQMRPIPAVHRLTPDDAGESAVGLHFTASAVGGTRDLVISGDTAWSDRLAEVYRSLKSLKPILVAHVSTACGEEALGALGSETHGYHPNHLGIRGVLEMIDACSPSQVVLSEIGEELKDVVDGLADEIHGAFDVPCCVGMLNEKPEDDVRQTRLRTGRLDLFAI
jgi:ribonuclease BN (tRNA processing enzyme)